MKALLSIFGVFTLSANCMANLNDIDIQSFRHMYISSEKNELIVKISGLAGGQVFEAMDEEQVIDRRCSSGGSTASSCQDFGYRKFNEFIGCGAYTQSTQEADCTLKLPLLRGNYDLQQLLKNREVSFPISGLDNPLENDLYVANEPSVKDLNLKLECNTTKCTFSIGDSVSYRKGQSSSFRLFPNGKSITSVRNFETKISVGDSEDLFRSLAFSAQDNGYGVGIEEVYNNGDRYRFGMRIYKGSGEFRLSLVNDDPSASYTFTDYGVAHTIIVPESALNVIYNQFRNLDAFEKAILGKELKSIHTTRTIRVDYANNSSKDLKFTITDLL
jgi:hypothetical protein